MMKTVEKEEETGEVYRFFSENEGIFARIAEPMANAALVGDLNTVRLFIRCLEHIISMTFLIAQKSEHDSKLFN